MKTSWTGFVVFSFFGFFVSSFALDHQDWSQLHRRTFEWEKR
ncbi:hypothetical protein JCM8547_007729, partial [Rhodosporidiobolus lusitaniae]